MGMLTPLLSRLSIADKDANIIPLKLNWAQDIYIEEVERCLSASIPIRLITLKARQLGISTITEAFLYCMSFALPNTRAAVIADEVDNSNHLLSMTDLYWETDPLAVLYRTKYQAKNTLHWVETASSIRTMTAGNKKAGRSRTLHMLHASEVAFWMEAEKVMTGLLQTIPQRPRTFVCIESTANGIGNYFNKEWNAAMSGQTEYIPLFFPWWCHPEYRASHINLPYADLGIYDEEEKNLLILFQHGLVIGPRTYTIPKSEWEDALAWRRWAIRNLCQNDLNKFHQEYPSYPEEAFIATGTNVFPQQHLGKCFEPFPGRAGRLLRDGNAVTFTPDVNGQLTLFRYPTPDTDYGVYVIGGDATQTMRGDYACAQVLNRRTLEQVAIWHGRISPAHFGEELFKLGAYFNYGLVASENEGPGFASIGALINMNYPNLYAPEQPDSFPGRGHASDKVGWSSSYKTKEFAVGWTLKLVVDHELVIHDRGTFDEMTNYVRLEGGEYGPADAENGHDDRVMAYVIAVASHVLSGPLPAHGTLGNAGMDVDQGRPVWEDWKTPDYEGEMA